MEKALMIAGQCWCDETTSGIEMDSRLAEAFARRLRDWIIEARIASANANYWRAKYSALADGSAFPEKKPSDPIANTIREMNARNDG